MQAEAKKTRIRPETQLKRRQKLSQIRARQTKRVQQSLTPCDATSVDFSVYKRQQMNRLASAIAPSIQYEVGPLDNQGGSLIPPKFSIY